MIGANLQPARSTRTFARSYLGAVAPAFLIVMVMVMQFGGAAQSAEGQANPRITPQAESCERSYAQSKSTVEKALKELQPSMSGRLPVLDGFALAGNHPLNRYQRAYYQSSVQVSSTAAGGSVVRVNTKVTAWYTDSTPSGSGYQLLTSNGRLESDFLDQLTDLLARGASESSRATAPPAVKRSATAEKAIADQGTMEPVISAPMPQLSETGRTFSSSLQQGLSSRQSPETKIPPSKAADPSAASLQAEAASLEEVLKNQAHPKNLVAIKKTGTPVVASPSLSAKTLFLASAHDEFEMLDFNADWVHVRISGLSRGWIWRTSLEMPEGISDIPSAVAGATPVAADLFQVTREESAPFPGDWEPLRGKNVKIISVQKIQENERGGGAQAKLEFSKSLVDKYYAELASKSQEVAGLVLIFDSVDGGMIAMTLPTVREWKAGRLTDAALWHRCYFDPPETFSISSASGGR
jgi:hypothetical protein